MLAPRLNVPPWMPPEQTVATLAAGKYWDAVAVPQDAGLTVMAMLHGRPSVHLGPVIWAPLHGDGRSARLYFLVTANADVDFTGTAARLLGRGTYVAVPGPTTLLATGIHWLAPPHPDEPTRLTDPSLLATVLRQVDNAEWVTVSAADGTRLELLVSAPQAAGTACLHCHTDRAPLHPGVTLTARVAVGVVRDTVSALCTPCVAVSH